MTSAFKPAPPGTPVPTLEDVRDRFVAAEDILTRTAGTLTELRSAIEVVEDVRQGIGAAGETLRSLYEPLVVGVDLLRTGAARLEEGVTQLRSSEPGILLRRLDSMEASLHSAQTATSERLQLLDRRADARSEDHGDRLQRLGGSLENRIGNLGSLFDELLAANRSLAVTLERVERDLAATRSGLREDLADSSTRMEATREGVATSMAQTLVQARKAADEESASLRVALDASLGRLQQDLRQQDTAFREVIVRTDASLRAQRDSLQSAIEAAVTGVRNSLFRTIIAAMLVSTVATALVVLAVVVG